MRNFYIFTLLVCMTLCCNSLNAKIPFVIVETESTQANDGEHKNANDPGQTTIYGERINYLTKGRIKSSTENVIDGSNPGRVIFKVVGSRAELVLATPRTTVNKVQIKGPVNIASGDTWKGFNVAIFYKRAFDTDWQGVSGQSAEAVTSDADITFNHIYDVVRIKLILTPIGSYVALSGINLWGGKYGTIIEDGSDPSVQDSNELPWWAYDANNNLIGVGGNDGHVANYDGVRTFWEAKKAQYGTIRFVVRGNNIDEQSCDLQGNQRMDVGNNQHLILENMGFAPVGLGITSLSGHSFVELADNGKFTLGANIYAFNAGTNEQYISCSGSGNKEITLHGILGEYRGYGQSIYMNGGTTATIKSVHGLDQWGAYEGHTNGINSNKTDKTIYNVILDPTGANLMKNGGFEDHAMWQKSGGGSNIMGYDRLHTRSGSKSMYIKGKNNDSGIQETKVEGLNSNKPKLIRNHAYYSRIYGYQQTKRGAENVQIYFGLAEPDFGTAALGNTGQWNLYSWRKDSHYPSGIGDGETWLRIDFDHMLYDDEIWYDDFLMVDLTEYAAKMGVSVSSLTKEVCDQIFSGAGNTTGETMLQVENGAMLQTITPPVRVGFTFLGYYDGIYGEGTKYINADGTPARTWDKQTAAMLYAKWVANADIPLTIDPNGGTHNGHSSQYVENIGNYSYATIAKPTREGYTFTGWSGTGEKYLTRAQAQYGSNLVTVTENSLQPSGDQFLNQVPDYITRDCSQEEEYTFSGKSNDVINLGRRHMHSDKLTVNAWAYMNNWADYVTDHKRVFSCTEGGGWNLENNNGYVQFAINVNNEYIHAKSNSLKYSNLASGWHMFTLTWDSESKTMKGYIDGNIIGQTSKAGTITYPTNATIMIGSEAEANRRFVQSNNFVGKQKNFGIINQALSDSEVAALFNNQNTTKYFSKESATIVANWRPNMYDLTYNANGGEIQTEDPYRFANITTWTPNGYYTSNITNVPAKNSVTYNSGTRTNTFRINGAGGSEHLYKQITLEANQTYEISLDYWLANTTDHYEPRNYILALQLLTAAPDNLSNYNEEKQLHANSRIEMFKGETNTTSMKIFTGNRTTFWLSLNLGVLTDGKEQNFTISNFSVKKVTTVGNTYGTLPTVTNGTEEFGGWYTSPECLPSQKVTPETVVTNPETHTLYAQWAVAKIGDQHFKTLQDAIDEAENGDEIELIKNVTENVTISKPIVLNGSNLQLNGDMTIEPTGALTVKNGYTVTGQLTLENQGVGANKKDGTVKGELVVQNHVVYKMKLNIPNATDKETHFYWISLPYAVTVGNITGPNLTDKNGNTYGFQQVLNGAWTIRDYNTQKRDHNTLPLDQVNFYEDLAASDVMNPKKGYLLQFSNMAFGQIDVCFPSTSATLTLNTEDVTGKTLLDYGINDAANSHWWLIGQPYFCNTFVQENGPQCIVKMVGGNDHFDYSLWFESEALKPYESFFVQYVGTVLYNNPAVAPSTKSTKEPYVIALNDGESMRRTGVILSDDASNSYTVGHDMAPIYADKKLQFYNKSKSNNLIFAELNKGSQTVPLGYFTTKSGEHTIEFTSLEQIPTDASVTLEDKFNNSFTNLRAGKYTFNTEKGTFDNRFVMHISKSTTNVTTPNGNHVLVCNRDNAIEISSLQIGTKVVLYHVSGKIIGSQIATSNSLTFNNLVSGFYILTIDNEPVKMTVSGR